MNLFLMGDVTLARAMHKALDLIITEASWRLHLLNETSEHTLATAKLLATHDLSIIPNGVKENCLHRGRIIFVFPVREMVVHLYSFSWNPAKDLPDEASPFFDWVRDRLHQMKRAAEFSHEAPAEVHFLASHGFRDFRRVWANISNADRASALEVLESSLWKMIGEGSA